MSKEVIKIAMKIKRGSLIDNQQFINIRCSVEKKKKIQELAAKAKISMSQYIILKCLEKKQLINIEV